MLLLPAVLIHIPLTTSESLVVNFGLLPQQHTISFSIRCIDVQYWWIYPDGPWNRSRKYTGFSLSLREQECDYVIIAYVDKPHILSCFFRIHVHIVNCQPFMLEHIVCSDFVVAILTD